MSRLYNFIHSKNHREIAVTIKQIENAKIHSWTALESRANYVVLRLILTQKNMPRFLFLSHHSVKPKTMKQAVLLCFLTAISYREDVIPIYLPFNTS